MNESGQRYNYEYRIQHADRPGFRIVELQLSPTQNVPWHAHSNVQDTFYVLNGRLKLSLQEPDEQVLLNPCETYSVPPRRPHLVENAGESSVTFLVLQGIGDYDFVALDS